MKRTEDETAAQARDLVRRAVGDASGLTIKGQLRQAARNLGYVAEAWRVKEAWYGRAGRWVGAALRELQDRFAAWRGQEAARPSPGRLAQRVGKVQRLLAELQREVEALEAEVAGLPTEHGGTTSDV